MLEGLAFEAGAFLLHLDAIDSLEADDVEVEEVALELIGKMAAAQDSGAWARTRGPIPELVHVRVLLRIVDAPAERRTEIRIVAGRVGDEIVAPIIEHAPVRVREAIRNVGLELAGAQFETIDRGVVVANDTGRGLNLRAMENAVAEVIAPPGS